MELFIKFFIFIYFCPRFVSYSIERSFYKYVTPEEEYDKL